MPQPIVGLHCSHEQLQPSTLLRHVTRAAAAGFTAMMCSDHFHPSSERQGHSGFAWSWLGAALQATSGVSFGTVCAPGQRYHPTVIAQAAATLAEMFPERFWLAVGSGEALNEAITGRGWPDKPARTARLEESVAVLRALWAGESISVRGHIQTENARLYPPPARPPLLLGAALTPETAARVATWADGLITVAGPRDGMRAVIAAFRERAGDAKPMFGRRTAPRLAARRCGARIRAHLFAQRRARLPGGVHRRLWRAAAPCVVIPNGSGKGRCIHCDSQRMSA